MPPSISLKTKYYFDVNKAEILVSIYLSASCIIYLGIPDHYDEIVMDSIYTVTSDVFQGPISNPYILTIKMRDGTIHRIDVSIPKVEF